MVAIVPCWGNRIMKIKYDEKKKRIVIDAERTTMFKDIGGKKVLIPTIEIENDTNEPRPSFSPVEIDNMSISIWGEDHSKDCLMSVSCPIQISILDGSDYGIEDIKGKDLPGDILTVEKARTLAKTLNDAADFVENVLTEEI